MRTTLAFVLGAALVSATWVVAHPSGTGSHALHPAPRGPAPVDGLGEPVPDFGWVGAGGELARLSDLVGSGPVVVALRDLGCPVSQRYGLRLRDLENAFSDRGVRFLYVDLTPSESGWSVRIPREQAELGNRYVRQIDETFFTGLEPRTSTEVFLIDEAGILRYRGAVDDQFGFDYSRQAPEHDYLETAIETVLDGKAPDPSATFAPGCYLHRHMDRGSSLGGSHAAG